MLYTPPSSPSASTQTSSPITSLHPTHQGHHFQRRARNAAVAVRVLTKLNLHSSEQGSDHPRLTCPEPGARENARGCSGRGSVMGARRASCGDGERLRAFCGAVTTERHSVDAGGGKGALGEMNRRRASREWCSSGGRPGCSLRVGCMDVGCRSFVVLAGWSERGEDAPSRGRATMRAASRWQHSNPH